MTVKVVRYTALLSGVFYGIAHRRTLQKEHDEEKKKHAIHEREHLIEQAKEAYRKQKEASSKDSGTCSPFRTVLLLVYPIYILWDVHTKRNSFSSCY